MSEPTFTNEQLTAADHPATGLSPSVRTIATDSIPAHDRSLAVSLCQLGGELAVSPADSHQQYDRILEAVTNAIAVFEGYVRIRRALLLDDRYDGRSTRDAAVLASDSLHATAYTMVADAPIPDGRALELYRILTEGSGALAVSFQARSSAGDGPGPTDGQRPDAILAGLGGALGVAAVGGAEETRTALEAYGRSLVAALAAHSSPTDVGSERAAAVLAGRPEPDAPLESSDAFRESDAASAETGFENAASSLDATTLGEHIERAREALSTLEACVSETAADESGPADPDAGTDGSSAAPDESTTAGTDRPPIPRLERATRIPFEDVVTDDG